MKPFHVKTHEDFSDTKIEFVAYLYSRKKGIKSVKKIGLLNYKNMAVLLTKNRDDFFFGKM